MSGGQITTIRGFRDLLGKDCEHTAALEEAARATFELYGYREIRIPTLEHAELFVKSTGETTDIVEKEMYKLTDAGGRHLALRPEGTPGVVRAFLNEHLGQQGPCAKLFYIGSMFRAERPQAGRYREFEQIGVESLGNPHPAADVEAILALKHLLDTVGLGDKTRLRLNNIGCDTDPLCRPRYRERLRAFLREREGGLCASCCGRIERNPLRALDCKKDGPGLAQDAPALEACPRCREHVESVVGMLDAVGCPHKYPDPGLVRGLDYYTSTVFEFQADGIGAQDALAGGGRYDSLVESLGGAPTPAVGWALGVERMIMAARAADPETAALGKILPPPKTDVFIVIATRDAATASIGTQTIESLRRFGIRTAGGLFALSLKAQMREAGRQGARFAVILGEDELKKEPAACMFKDMENGRQEEIALANLKEIAGGGLLSGNTHGEE
ncbi:MAG: histidine--tRNA ligase [Elusimicrobiota bacterium]